MKSLSLLILGLLAFHKTASATEKELPECKLQAYNTIWGLDPKHPGAGAQKKVYIFEASDFGKNSMYAGILVSSKDFNLKSPLAANIQYLIIDKDSKRFVIKDDIADFEEWSENKSYLILKNFDPEAVNKSFSRSKKRPTHIHFEIIQNEKVLCQKTIQLLPEDSI